MNMHQYSNHFVDTDQLTPRQRATVDQNVALIQEVIKSLVHSIRTHVAEDPNCESPCIGPVALCSLQEVEPDFLYLIAVQALRQIALTDTTQ